MRTNPSLFPRRRAYLSRLAASSSLLAVFAIDARASDVGAPDGAAQTTAVPDSPDLVFELGAGARIKPAYEAASDYEVSPFPIFKMEYLDVPGLLTIGGGTDLGFSIGPSFDITGERDSSEHDELSGLNDVDTTYELGLKASYEWEYAEVYGEARYAFGGADGLVGNIGANAIFRPAEGLEVKLGPTASFAGSDYMDTYFGVTPAESIATGGRLSAYDAEGGIKSAGVATEIRYEFRPDWILNVEASYTSMLADAKDSPITEVGESDQFTFGLGVSRRFSLDLFD